MPSRTVLGGLLQGAAGYLRGRTAEEQRRTELTRRALQDALGLAQAQSTLQTQALQRDYQRQLMSGYETPEQERQRRYAMAMRQAREMHGLQEGWRQGLVEEQRQQLRPVLERQVGELQPWREGAQLSALQQPVGGMVGGPVMGGETVGALAQPVETAPDVTTTLDRSPAQPARDLTYEELVGEAVAEGGAPQFLPSGLLAATGVPSAMEQEAARLGTELTGLQIAGARQDVQRGRLLLDATPQELRDEAEFRGLRNEGQALYNATRQFENMMARETAPDQLEASRLNLELTRLQYGRKLLESEAFEQALNSDDPELQRKAWNALFGIQTILSDVTPAKADMETTLAEINREIAQLQARAKAYAADRNLDVATLYGQMQQGEAAGEALTPDQAYDEATELVNEWLGAGPTAGDQNLVTVLPRLKALAPLMTPERYADVRQYLHDAMSTVKPEMLGKLPHYMGENPEAEVLRQLDEAHRAGGGRPFVPPAAPSPGQPPQAPSAPQPPNLGAPTAEEQWGIYR